MSQLTLFTLPFLHITHSFALLKIFLHHQDIMLTLLINDFNKILNLYYMLLLNKEQSDLGDTRIYRFLFTFFPKLSRPLLLVVDGKP